MAPPTPQQPLRYTPVAMLYLGLPAYLMVVVVTTRDVFLQYSAARGIAVVLTTVVFTAAFLWLAFTQHELSTSRAFVPTAVMGILAIVLALLGVNSSVYAAATAAMAGDSLLARHAVPVILGSAVLASAGAYGHGLETPDIVTWGIIVVTVGFFTVGARRLGEANAALLEAREEVARLAVLDERVRFARDLHDVLGHSLTVIRAKSELAGRVAASDVDRAAKEMREVEEIARNALAEVRETVTGYRQPTFASELGNARTALQAADIRADVHADAIDLPTDVDETLAWVLREMVTNVVRHSHASVCHINATADRTSISLTVADDGHGSNGAAGNGLTGARERLDIIGGTLEIDGSSHAGYRVVARVPR